MFTKNAWIPSIGERLQLRRQDHERLQRSCRERREGRDYSRSRSPRDVMHILALHYAWWERWMRDNGKEDARRMRYNGKEDARKRGGGRINEGGAFMIPFLSMRKKGGGGGGG